MTGSNVYLALQYKRVGVRDKSDRSPGYSTGPWGVSATYFHGEWEASLADDDDDEVDAIVGAVSYALGPGITTSASVLYAKYEDEGGAEADAIMSIVCIGVKF